MPLVSDLQLNKKNKFEKKAYRPWDHTLPIADETEILLNNEKLDEKYIDLQKELRALYGAQKVIILYLLKQIDETTDHYVVTKNISMNDLISMSNIPENTIKGTLQKLKSKNLFETYENKPGRGGYARYKFTKNIYDFLFENLINIL